MKNLRKLAPKELMDALIEVVGDLPDESALSMARRVAIGAIRLYGEGDEREVEWVTRNDIWNDHPAVQASLAIIRGIGRPATEGEGDGDTTKGTGQ